MFGSFKIGDYGHLFVIISFIAAAIAAFAYWKNSVLAANPLTPSNESSSWKKFARGAFLIHAASVIGVIVTLFYIIYNHRYEYYYAYDHSSNDLPTHYMISCFWEGQEGSFLLWIFWQVVLGLILIIVNKTWEGPMMAVFCLVQAFLTSMIIGVAFPIIDFKLGSSPFILFKEQMGHLPVFQIRPDYVPEDGSGLNALLQNYWMVIHPPTLFLGFAATLVPFCYCLAGLWQKKYREWVRPALPWALFAALVLGTGILMGGYWAYETLNFGGYWNWDPVENAVYAPWVVLVASIHTMIAFRNSNNALKASIILSLTTFLLILYSTFLTRSGILGDSSVHSFTDLGLSGQLLIYLLAFVFLSIFVSAKSWKHIPKTEDEITLYSREFWIFIGVTILCGASLQVLATTSIPVYNKILHLIGINTQKTRPADPIEHYTVWQLWFAVFIAILSGLGQFFWWKKIDKKKIWDAISIPLIITLLAGAGLILVADIKSIKFIALITASIFSITANLFILIPILKNNIKLSGGAISHIGLGLMLIGILFSAGYSKVITSNVTNVNFSKDQSVQKENVFLWRAEPVKMGDYTLTYKGAYWRSEDFPGYISQDDVVLTDDIRKIILRKDLTYKDKTYFHAGDTVEVSPENNYYEVDYTKEDGDHFTLFPRVQVNEQMGGFVVSPDIERFADRDLYTHISSIPSLEEEKKWSEPEEISAKVGDTMFVNDHVAILDTLISMKKYPGVKISEKEGVTKASIRILGKNGTHIAEPAIAWNRANMSVGFIPDMVEDLGMVITFKTIGQETNGEHKYHFTVSTTERDWIVLKAIEKPMINVLWIGTLLLVLGLFIAIVRRYTEFAKMRDKGVE